MRRLQITLSLSLILLFATAASAKIVFSAYKDGGTNIYVMDDDGSNIRQITDYPHSDVDPRWSPDGKQITFLRDTEPSSRVYRNTFIMNADGTHIRQLTNHRANNKGLAFSPDGRKLIASRNSGAERFETMGLYVIDIESGDIQQISNLEMMGVDWSPNGKEIVFTNDELSLTEKNLWIMNADGTNARPLMPPIIQKRTMDRRKPRWSPDGQQILHIEVDKNVTEDIHPNGGIGFFIRTAGTYRYRIYNLNDGGTQTLKIPEGWWPYSVTWMNGQNSVLFCAFVDYEHRQDHNRWIQIYRYDIASGIITQLTHDRGNKRGADWVSDDASNVTSVSPAGKQSMRWGELKKAYSD